jgi:hypothetical protein
MEEQNMGRIGFGKWKDRSEEYWKESIIYRI